MSRELSSILEAIGRTPLIKLDKITDGIPSGLYVKVECLNPGGSVKDRIGFTMVEAAEREGKLKPGGTIIEATAGNTGVGLVLVAAVKGYRAIFVMPDKMSEDKVNLLKAYGAEVIITPTAVPPDSPESYNGVADRLAREIPGAFRPNQFENTNNPLAHYMTTGPEIWEDSGGKVQVFVAGMGTGGTISGVGEYLKEKNPDIIVVGADPEGSILSGDTPRPFKVEGIGEDFIPKTFNRQVVDDMVRVSDKESFNTARRLAREEGLLVGGSSGTAVAAALKYARRLAEPKYIVALLPDTGRNYLTKMYCDSWMRQYGFWEGASVSEARMKDILSLKKSFSHIIFVGPTDTLEKAIWLMRENDISQIPVIDVETVVGSLNEVSVMKALREGVDVNKQEIAGVMGKPLPSLDEDTDVTEAYGLFLSGVPAVVVTSKNVPEGIVTRWDLIESWAVEREGCGSAV
ncbi:MAG: cystathionine beta-synthase [Actinobacteria bacterium]|nr:cystathionine beta-synthase [Actinomycetota bacterium]MCG2820203.1 cystathionine beta-synthase [Actinomycetes bacterium]MBU4219825.1 cystathionine beta-synthase [Actinomycetota bacterium]MBU4357719.1 cystathionine beta-synthase [Actinomycetota bacterium]MBU4393279.1 cystathionine beta-synthase [Actinomycetota bacterium]